MCPYLLSLKVGSLRYPSPTSLAPNLLLKLAEFNFPRGSRYASCGASRHQYTPASLLQYTVKPCHLMTPLEALARDATNFPLVGRLDTVVSSTPSAEPR
jgi:hypothetical protein